VNREMKFESWTIVGSEQHTNNSWKQRDEELGYVNVKTTVDDDERLIDTLVLELSSLEGG